MPTRSGAPSRGHIRKRACLCLKEWTTVFQCSGSVFPVSLLVALPNAVIAAVLQWAFPGGSLSLFGEDGGILTETIVWSGFTFLLGFLVVFRTSQSYARWWEGCTAAHFMRAEWFDALMTLSAFAHHGNGTPEQVIYFKRVLVRLGSMLHATALAELEKGGNEEEDRYSNLFYSYELIAPDDFDPESLQRVKHSPAKVELIYGWILHHIMDGIDKGVLSSPPPLLTRAFQELASGLVHYHNAVKLSMSPFPFAYAQTCDGLLLIQWIIAPVVTSQWATHAVWAALFSFIQVFVLSLLNSIAGELSNPFGSDTNDVDGAAMQVDMNLLLSLVMEPGSDKVPTIEGGWDELERHSQERRITSENSRKSLSKIFNDDDEDVPRRSTSSPVLARLVSPRLSSPRLSKPRESSPGRFRGASRGVRESRQQATPPAPPDAAEARACARETGAARHLDRPCPMLGLDEQPSPPIRRHQPWPPAHHDAEAGTDVNEVGPGAVPGPVDVPTRGRSSAGGSGANFAPLHPDGLSSGADGMPDGPRPTRPSSLLLPAAHSGRPPTAHATPHHLAMSPLDPSGAVFRDAAVV